MSRLEAKGKEFGKKRYDINEEKKELKKTEIWGGVGDKSKRHEW